MKNFYLTTTLPYVNSDPHVGFALEIVQADCIARFHALKGDSVFFNTGTDEHGIKIWRKATELGKEPQAYVDEWAEKFRGLKVKLNLYPDLHFIRTTDPHHKAAAQEFWNRCNANGDIYKKSYEVKYCVGCELEKTDSELVHGRCPIHPNLDIEHIKEENYFFRFSKYASVLREHYAAHPDFVVPDFRFNEIRAFVERGLEDFSISRLKSKMPWGVPVPGDDTQVFYVWFDALINYISTLGWPYFARQEESELRRAKPEKTDFDKFWGTIVSPNALQVAGKDNLRQQSAMWQAMLFSAGLPPTKQIIIHGFITSGGQKMSKSLGNVINPYEIVDEYGADALRIFLLKHMHPFEDSDFTMDKFKEAYNADLANGLGNLAARIMTLAEANLPGPVTVPSVTFDSIEASLSAYNYKEAAEKIWQKIQSMNQFLTDEKPFSVIKSDPEKGKAQITMLAQQLYEVAGLLEPMMPQTSATIKKAVEENKKPENLFPRK